MGDSLDTPDFLTAALRQSRDAIPDDGFSLRVARLALAERRRARWLRFVPLLTACMGLVLSLALSGLTVGRLLREFSALEDGFAEALSSAAPVFGLFSHYGLSPWMVVAAVGAIVYALGLGSKDSRAAF